MWRALSGPLGLVLVSEYPKSGGTWLCQMLARGLELPFPQNRLPLPRPSIMHGHHLYRSGFRNAVYVLRDGRDVIVSAYHHHLFHNERNQPLLVEIFRRQLGFSDYEDLQTNLPKFIEYMFTVHARGRFRFNWGEFVRSWNDSPGLGVRYEDLLAEPAAHLERVIRGLGHSMPEREALDRIAEDHSFKRLSGRERGQERQGSFLRKGIAGDWKNHFTSSARRVFDQLAGAELVTAGYEPDRSWVDTAD